MRLENTKLTQETEIYSNNIIAINDTIEFWKDKSNNYFSEKKILSATNEMLLNQYNLEHEKYLKLFKDYNKNNKMIAYLESTVIFKDSIIQELSNNFNYNNSFIKNDSILVLNIEKVYDSLNYYKLYGNIVTTIKENKLIAGKLNLHNDFSIKLNLGITIDDKTKQAKIVSKSAFPAKVYLDGITEIESIINKKPKRYIGIGLTLGYGSTLQQNPTLSPFIGIGVFYTPKWLTFKIY
ncbi:MAG: hypothetical protein M0P99_00220 [Candidatus Cloacimonetes bacterium]|nr:hypothetical protein [Candidatus Cloacimonadota bacterium]